MQAAAAFVSLSSVFEERFLVSRACHFAIGDLPVNTHNHAFLPFRGVHQSHNKDQAENQWPWLNLAAGALM
jgi:hypothetical protein